MKLIKKLVIGMMIATMMVSACYAADTKIAKPVTIYEDGTWEKFNQKQDEFLIEGIKANGQAVNESIKRDGMIVTLENVYVDKYSIYALVSVKKEDQTKFDWKDTALQEMNVSLRTAPIERMTVKEGPKSTSISMRMCERVTHIEDTVYFIMKDTSTLPMKKMENFKLSFKNLTMTTYEKDKQPVEQLLAEGSFEYNVKLDKEAKILVKNNIIEPYVFGENKSAQLKQVIITPLQVMVYMDHIKGALTIDDDNRVQVKMKDGTIHDLKPVGGSGCEEGDEDGPSGINASYIDCYEILTGVINVDNVDSLIINGKSFSVK